jgi:hypothetical protein
MEGGGGMGARNSRLALVLKYRVPSCGGLAYRKHCKFWTLPKFGGPLAGTILPWLM